LYVGRVHDVTGQVGQREERGAAGQQLDRDPTIPVQEQRPCSPQVSPCRRVGTGIDDIEDAPSA
jgi:hypothetical protein